MAYEVIASVHIIYSLGSVNRLKGNLNLDECLHLKHVCTSENKKHFLVNVIICHKIS